MRTRLLLAGLLVLALAGCSSGATPTPAAPSPTPTPEPSVAPAATPAPTQAVLDVKVAFDGETCTYYGPTVILDGTVVRFEYVPAEGLERTSLLVYGVAPGTTWEVLQAAEGGPPVPAPDWVYEGTAGWVQSAGAMLFTVESVKHGTTDTNTYAVGGYGVSCTTPKSFPVDPDRIWHAALLTVAGP